MNINPAPVPPANWTCSECGTSNSVLSATCSGCSKARGAFQKLDGSDQLVQDFLKDAIRTHLAVQAARAGDPNDMNPIPIPEWTCSKCGTRNRVTTAACSNCGNTLIPVQNAGDPNDMFPVPVPEWICSKCGTRNRLTHPTCSNCGNALVPVQDSDNAKGTLGTPKWTCKKCGSENGVNDANCSNCGTPMMGGQGAAGAAKDDSIRSALQDQIKAARDAALRGLKKPPG